MPFKDPEKRKAYNKQYMLDNYERDKKHKKQYYLTNKEHIQNRQSTYYNQNKEVILEQQRNSGKWKIRRAKNRKLYLYNAAKQRARVKNIPFNIDVDDIIIPTVCPILEIPMYFDEIRTDNTPSLDKIIQDNGYVKGNIQVISTKANTLKNTGTLDELIKLGKWAEKYKQRVNNDK